MAIHMSLFLFAKQIVDMLYNYKILDITMVFCAVIMCIYQIALIRPPVKELLYKADCCMIAETILLTGTLLRFGRGVEEYAKIMSAFLLYFLGRICYERIGECYHALVMASYINVFCNLFHRVFLHGDSIFQLKNAYGDFYYDDIDMAFAMILSMTFILMYGKNHLMQLFVVFIACPYMVWFSKARIFIGLFLVIYFLYACYQFEKVLKKEMFKKLIMKVSIVALGAALIFLMINGIKICIGGQLSVDSLLGTGIAYRVGIDQLYRNVNYTVGIAGSMIAILFLFFVLWKAEKCANRKLFYMTIALLIPMLVFGLCRSSIDRTQMCWFAMLYMGMLQSDKIRKY